MLRTSPSGPDSGFLVAAQTGTVPVLAAAGDSASVTVTCPGAKVGDIGTASSATLLAAGVVLQRATSAADNAMTVTMIATKAYGGAVVADFSLAVTRFQ